MHSIAELYQQYLRFPRVNTDSRRLEPGTFFVCLKGDRFNGNDFAQQALDGGAAVVVMDEDRGIRDSRVMRVWNGLESLQELARHHRSQLKIPIIGLTGSNGKTTSKELFNAVLSRKFSVSATIGNLNNHIGVPLTLLAITEKHQIGIVEMGANAQGEIAFLSEIAQPDIGYITNFGKAHLEGFGGVQGVIKGKSELYDYLRTHSKVALVNSSDELQMTKSQGIERLLFGTNEAAPNHFELDSEAPDLVCLWGERAFRSQLSGAYNFSNIAAAFRLGLHFGIDPDKIISGIETYAPTNQRSERQKSNRNSLIVDCYNANPSSMSAALENLKKQSGKRMAILGDMFELGPYEAQEHQRIVDQIEKSDIEKALLIGHAFSKTRFSNKIRTFETRSEAEEEIRKTAPSGFTILLKGSRGMELEKLLPVL